MNGMRGRMKVAIVIVFFLALPFFWWKGIREIVSYAQSDPSPTTTEEQFRPFRNPQLNDPQISSRAVLSMLLQEDKKAVLLARNKDARLPIASLSKLMTALVVINNYDLQKEINITQAAISQEGDFGQLKINHVYTVEYLLYPLLMESSNDAAYALANDYEGMNLQKFLGLMNDTAKSLGMSTSTHFLNPSGLEPEEDRMSAGLNYSTADDLIKLTKELLKKPLIWQILSLSEYNVYGPELKSTNKLLTDETINWRNEILGGKTGYTAKAGGCMFLVLKAPDDKGYIVNVILGTANNDERFNQMKKLVEWLKTAYIWQ